MIAESLELSIPEMGTDGSPRLWGKPSQEDEWMMNARPHRVI